MSQIDMQKNIEGTSKNYNHHILLCTGESDWSISKFQVSEPSESENKANIEKFKKSVKIVAKNAGKLLLGSLCDVSPTHQDRIDVIVFPEAKKIVGVELDDFEETLLHFLNHSSLPENSFCQLVDIATEKSILVCSHMSKDQRCGVMGIFIFFFTIFLLFYLFYFLLLF